MNVRAVSYIVILISCGFLPAATMCLLLMHYWNANFTAAFIATVIQAAVFLGSLIYISSVGSRRVVESKKIDWRQMVAVVGLSGSNFFAAVSTAFLLQSVSGSTHAFRF